MYRKSQIRIIAAIMAATLIILGGTLLVIYGASAYSMSTSNMDMLEHYAALYAVNGPPKGLVRGDLPAEADELPAGDRPVRRLDEDGPGHSFEIATFYAVTIADDGTATVVDNVNTSYSDEELKALAQSCVSDGSKDRGTTGSLMYLAAPQDGYTLVVFMDNTILTNSAATLLRYTLIFGAVAAALLFVFAYFLSRRIIRPLKANNESQKQFISDAGHELKTPVSVISANAEMLERQIGDNPWLNNIRFENERMAGLTTQLLELAKTEHVAPEQAPFDLSQTVTGCVLPFESLAFEEQAALRYDIAPELVMNGNADQIGQLATILLDNALAHTGAGGQVDVTLKEDRHRAVLAVSNTGEAIPEDQRQRIFERFYQLDDARATASGRYGLGLAIAKAIVEAHRGTIAVTCGGGRVTFTAVLPLR